MSSGFRALFTWEDSTKLCALFTQSAIENVCLFWKLSSLNRWGNRAFSIHISLLSLFSPLSPLCTFIMYFTAYNLHIITLSDFAYFPFSFRSLSLSLHSEGPRSTLSARPCSLSPISVRSQNSRSVQTRELNLRVWCVSARIQSLSLSLSALSPTWYTLSQFVFNISSSATAQQSVCSCGSRALSLCGVVHKM